MGNDIELVQWLGTLGVGGILAGVMFAFYRKDVKAHTDMWRGQTEILIQVVRDNTIAIASNTSTIQALHRRNDMIESALAQMGFKFPHPPRQRDRDEP